MSKIKFKRSDYMNRRCSHREYYAQFVDQNVKDMVANIIGVGSIQWLLEFGNEENKRTLNGIPLAKWDRLSPYIFQLKGKMLKEAGDTWSLAGSVCIAKEAAKQLGEEYQNG